MQPSKPPQNRKPAAFAFMAKAFTRGESLRTRELAEEFECSLRTAERWIAEYDRVVERLTWRDGRAVLR